MKTLIAAPFALAAVLAFAAPTLADSRIDRSGWLGVEEIAAQLKADGYTAIREIDADDDGYYEVEATNAQGQKVDLDVNPRTGKVLRSELDD